MPNFRPDQARLARRFAVLLAATFWLTGALAVPDAATKNVDAAASVDAVHGPTVEPAANGDALLRLLADKALAAAPTPAAPRPEDAQPQPGDSRFAERVRDKASDMVLTAMNFLGVPYRRGGDDADRGFDCSGFTRHIFELSLGLLLPRRAEQQATGAGLLRVGREQLKPGDLVFFNTMRRTFSHVGIYVGAGKFIHSPKPGGEVRVDDLHASYWEKRFTGGRRVDAIDAPASTEPTTAGARTLN